MNLLRALQAGVVLYEALRSHSAQQPGFAPAASPTYNQPVYNEEALNNLSAEIAETYSIPYPTARTIVWHILERLSEMPR